MFDYVEFVAEYAPYDLYALENLGRAIDLFPQMTALDKSTITVTWKQPFIEADTMFTHMIAFNLPPDLHKLPSAADLATAGLDKAISLDTEATLTAFLIAPVAR